MDALRIVHNEQNDAIYDGSLNDEINIIIKRKKQKNFKQNQKKINKMIVNSQ